MYQISLGNGNTSEVEEISSLLLKLSFVCWSYISEEVIKEVYESNSGIAYETCKEAVKTDSSIILQDVKDYLGKRDDIQVISKPGGSNRFVSPGAKFELEIDIMCILARDGGESVWYGMVAIDMFTKIAEVIPIENRPDIINIRIKLIFQSMGNRAT